MTEYTHSRMKLVYEHFRKLFHNENRIKTDIEGIMNVIKYIITLCKRTPLISRQLLNEILFNKFCWDFLLHLSQYSAQSINFKFINWITRFWIHCANERLSRPFNCDNFWFVEQLFLIKSLLLFASRRELKNSQIVLFQFKARAIVLILKKLSSTICSHF